jgi:DNA-binding IclR family transcriptional regulator
MARPALSAARAVDVLNFLASHPDQGFTLSELVRRLGVNVASMHAILAVLAQAEYVTRDDARRTYTTGPMLVPLGHAALHRHGAIVAARAALEKPASDLGVTGLVVGAAGSEMVILDEVASQPDRAPSVGQRIRMIAPMGGVFVAWSDAERFDQWLATAPAAVREQRAELERWLESIRGQGYAVGLETTARQGLRRAVRDLREQPGSRAAKGRLRTNVAQLGDIATVLLEGRAKESYAVAHVAAPIRSHEGVSLSLYLMGFRRPLAADELERTGEALRDAADEVAGAATRDAARDANGAPADRTRLDAHGHIW